MSHDEDFKDSTGLGLFALALVALVACPLLPMLMGWFTMLR
jgi:hypothetical protein